MIFEARSFSVNGALPGGPPRHFCKPALTTSSCQASAGRSMPPSVAVASTYRMASAARQKLPRGESGCAMVVEVSPCETATSLGRNSRIAFSSTSGGNTVPHSVSSARTSAPQRFAISTFRWPKRPNPGTSTQSPGSMSETSAASIAARAVPSTSRVQRYAVWNTPRYGSAACFMYSRNTGSNWPSSGALIARSTRGSALIGPGPMRRRGGGLIGRIASLSMGMVLEPVARDVDAPRNPDLLVLHVADESLERGQAAGAAREAAVQADRHHAMLLGVQHVEAVLQIGEEIVARVEALRGGEAHVVGVERIRHHQLRLAVSRVVPGDVVVVVVGVVDEAAVLHHQAARVGAGAPGVPAERALAGQPAMHLDRALHVLALHLQRHVLGVHPAPAVARHFVPGLEECLDRGRVALHCHRHAEYGERHLMALEQLEQPPHADARAVFVERFH